MEDLEHVLVVDQQVEEGGKVDPVRERVDRGGFVLVGDLHQAQLGPEGVLAHELGVDADEFGLGEPGAEIGERLGGGDQWMDLHRVFLFCRVERSTAPGRSPVLTKRRA